MIGRMKLGGFLLLLFCSLLAVFASGQESCPANFDEGSSEEWKRDFFPGIPKIKYEGPNSKNPLFYKWYNAEEEILGKKMKDWFRFSVAFWHTFRGTGADPFGAPSKSWPWEDGTNSIAMAKRRMRAHFEFINKLGVDWWCFHDRDIAPDGKTLAVHGDIQILNCISPIPVLRRIMDLSCQSMIFLAASDFPAQLAASDLSPIPALSCSHSRIFLAAWGRT